MSVFIAFALMGIGNTVIQAALPPLMSNVVSPKRLTSSPDGWANSSRHSARR